MNKLIINGFGRIGKAVLYQLIINKIDIKEIIINQPNLNLSKMREIILYDSIYGLFNVNISIKKDHLFVNLNGIFYTLFVTSFQNLFENSNLNLNEFKIIDCTGINYNKNYFFNIINKFKNFTLLLSYWSVSFGHIINNSFSKKLSNSKIYSMGYCDTNAIFPILNIIELNGGVKNISITTLHPWLGYQKLLDSVNTQNDDAYITRSAINNIIPRNSSIPNAIKFAYPELSKKISFSSYRIPTELVSLADFSILFESKKKLVGFYKELKKNRNNVLITNDHLVSRDLYKNTDYYVLDLNSVKKYNNKIRFHIWYNNELAFARHIIEKINSL